MLCFMGFFGVSNYLPIRADALAGLALPTRTRRSSRRQMLCSFSALCTDLKSQGLSKDDSADGPDNQILLSLLISHNFSAGWELPIVETFLDFDHR